MTLIFGLLSFLLVAGFSITSGMVLTLYYVTPEQVTQFCEESISTADLNGITKTVVDGVTLYIDDID